MSNNLSTPIKRINDDVPTTPIDTTPFRKFSQLQSSQEYVTMAKTKRVITSIPIYKRPPPSWFVRINPAPETHLRFDVIITDGRGGVEDSKDVWLVVPHVANYFRGALAGLNDGKPEDGNAMCRAMRTMDFYVGQNTAGSPFLWYVPTDSDNSWHESARECIDRALVRWVRLVANMDAKGYDRIEASESYHEPVWTRFTDIDELLDKAFKKKIVETTQDDVILRLLGEIE